MNDLYDLTPADSEAERNAAPDCWACGDRGCSRCTDTYGETR